MDEPCGRDLANNAAVAERLAELFRHVADNLEAHARWVGSATPEARLEHDAMRRVAAGYREIGEAAGRAAETMRAAGDLPAAPHDLARFDRGAFEAWIASSSMVGKLFLLIRRHFFRRKVDRVRGSKFINVCNVAVRWTAATTRLTSRSLSDSMDPIMRLSFRCLGILASSLCSGCFIDGGQPGTEATDHVGGHYESGEDAAPEEETTPTPPQEGETDTSESNDEADSPPMETEGQAGGPIEPEGEAEGPIEDGPTEPEGEADGPIAPLQLDRPTAVHDPGTCLPSTVQEGDDFCSARQVCTGNTIAASCTTTGGVASCVCQDSFGGLAFSLPGLSAGVCGSILEACKVGDIVYGEPVCAEPITRVFDRVCQTDRRCEIPLMVGAIGAFAYDDQQSFCTISSAGGMNCTSSTATRYSSYHLAENDLQAGCEQALAVCASGGDPSPFTESPSCASSDQGRAEDSCIIATSCIYSADLGEGVTQTAAAGYVINCGADTGGSAWGCRCADNRNSVYFDIPSNASGSEICTNLAEPCKSLHPETVFRDATCSRVPRTASRGVCYAELDCQRPFSLGGLDVVLHAPLGISCKQADPALGWQCECSAADHHVITVDAEDALGACDTAAAPCQELAELSATSATAE
ncbi:hypothetical protein WME77_09510 [Sorangium sp. So ce764]|uniref:hypothetical protein n=1 Tax=Sorangium sp. So ce764 TaxID=3133320 RepID=UPI003F5DE1DA